MLASILQLALLVVVSLPSWRKGGVEGFVRYVVAAVGLTALAIALFAQRAVISGALSIVLANALMISAHQLWMEALHRFCGIDRGTRTFEAAFAVFCVVAVAVVWGLDDSPRYIALAKPRVAMATLPLVTSGLLWLRALYAGTPRPWPIGRKYLAWAAVLAVILNCARALVYVIADTPDDPVDSQSSSTLAVILLNLIGVFSAFGLILEVEARSRATLVDANDKLSSVASTDALTGLGNRRRLEERADVLLATARTDGAPITVMVLDIDYFKQINDRWGHDVGDRVLCAVAKQCVVTLRDADVLVRWGGEEFAAVLPRCSPDAAAAVGHRILDAIRAARMLPPGSGPVTASIGIAAVYAGEQTLTGAIRRADAAMYRAKAAGRDRLDVHVDAAS